MSTKINPKTHKLLRDLKEGKIPTEEVFHANPDALDQRIEEEQLRIHSLFFAREMDLMLILLNNKEVLSFPLSRSKRLVSATDDELGQYEISRTGVHWPTLDEDLSLKRFLQEDSSVTN